MIYIVYGQDESRRKKKIGTLRSKYQKYTVEIFDAKTDSQSRVLNAIDSISIFDDGKIVIIENSNFLSAKNTTNYEVEPFLQRKDSCILVLVYEGDKLDQRKKAVKELLQNANIIQCISLDDRSRTTYLHEQLKEKKIEMDPDAFRWFSSRIGYDTLRIDSELEKLKTYSDHISLEDVKTLIVPEPIDDVFKMVDALFDKNAIRFLAFYRNFRSQNMEPVAIIGLLASQIRFLFQVRVCMDSNMNQDQIASKIKAHPYRVKLNMKRALNFDSDTLLKQLSELATLDQNMKLGKVDKDEGFERWILSML